MESGTDGGGNGGGVLAKFWQVWLGGWVGRYPETFRRTRYVGKVPCSFASGVWPT